MSSEERADIEAIDVSHLGSTAFDTRSPLWWGNLWGLVIETAAFGILVAVYATVAMNTSPFPPVRSSQLPVLYESSPDLLLPTIGLVVLLISLIPDIWLDVSARRRDPRSVKIAASLTLVTSISVIVIRYFEFDSLHFKWDDNAYGSITWMLLGMHLLHVIVLTFEDIYILAWLHARELDEKHALDMTVTAVYSYWIVGTWVLLFPLIYIAPRFM